MKPSTCQFTVKKQPVHSKEASIAQSTWYRFEVLTVNALEEWQISLPCSVSVQTVCGRCVWDESMPIFFV